VTILDTTHAEVLRLSVEAETHARHARYTEAAACLRKALALDPEWHSAHRRIWELYDMAGKLPQVIRAFRQALTERLRLAPAPNPELVRPRVEHTTLCAVDCLNPELSIAALQVSMARCRFDAVKLLTCHDVSAPGIETIPIAAIPSTAEYSRFMVKGLLPYIGTDHLLYVQWDGFVVNAELWDPAFLLYDYVGARWPASILPDHPEQSVGNGGFSLRSRALLEALQDPEIDSFHPEDAVISRRYRPYLEQRHGIAFADEKTADRFSSEHCAQNTPTFGFHGAINLSRHLPWPEFQRFEFFE
jgi:tetratricopeptide (TPR) repeat protein